MVIETTNASVKYKYIYKFDINATNQTFKIAKRQKCIVKFKKADRKIKLLPMQFFYSIR